MNVTVRCAELFVSSSGGHAQGPLILIEVVINFLNLYENLEASKQYSQSYESVVNWNINKWKKVVQEPRGTHVHIYLFRREQFLFNLCGVLSMVSLCL
jgi:hypothetical protein